jgi:hypothetical protein
MTQAGELPFAEWISACVESFAIIAAELLFLAVLLGVLVLTWPAPPWALLQYGGLALMVIAPFLFFPFSKTLFLAFDLLFRPAPGGER